MYERTRTWILFLKGRDPVPLMRRFDSHRPAMSRDELALLAREADARFVAEMLATWAQRYLRPPAR